MTATNTSPITRDPDAVTSEVAEARAACRAIRERLAQTIVARTNELLARDRATGRQRKDPATLAEDDILGLPQSETLVYERLGDNNAPLSAIFCTVGEGKQQRTRVIVVSMLGDDRYLIRSVVKPVRGKCSWMSNGQSNQTHGDVAFFAETEKHFFSFEEWLELYIATEDVQRARFGGRSFREALRYGRAHSVDQTPTRFIDRMAEAYPPDEDEKQGIARKKAWASSPEVGTIGAARVP